MKDKHKKDHAKSEQEATPANNTQVGGDLPAPAPVNGRTLRLGKDLDYERELARLQVELVKLQEWVRHEGLRVVVLFEGRDAAGKGGAIKRITESLNPRVCRVVALGTPTEREKTQWYFQRYVPHLPAAGEMVLFDRSWYNRAGVERVMGFCTETQYQEFMQSCPEFERMLQRSGIRLIKYWFSVSDEEQERRFQDRMKNPTKRWKLSPMDLAVAQALGRLFARQGRNVRGDRYQNVSVVCGECGEEKMRPPERDPASSVALRLPRSDARAAGVAQTGKVQVRAPADPGAEFHSAGLPVRNAAWNHPACLMDSKAILCSHDFAQAQMVTA